MRYRISEFCRLLGVSTDTLRYYERCKLITTEKDPDNQYRSFSREDGLAIWNLHMLRSMDMSCNDIRQLRLKADYESQTNYLHQRADELAVVIDKLMAKHKRLLQLAQLHALANDVGIVRLLPESSAHWALYVLGDGCAEAATSAKETAHWVDCLPFTYFSLEISESSLLTPTKKLQIRIGLGILAENVLPAGLTLCADAIYTPPQKQVCMVIRTHDVFKISHRDMKPLYAYIAENQLRIAGPATGRILNSDGHMIKPEYRVVLGIPVADLS